MVYNIPSKSKGGPVMKHYALIGEHLGHSLSVPVHEAIFRHMGINADYRLIEIPRERFREEVPRLMAELDGFNVTIPYKEDILPFLRGMDDATRAIGAVNTVTRDGIGHNTDVPGFMDELRRGGIDPKGQPCFVLGTGGASKAVRVALESMGAAGVTMVSRHPRAEGEIDYAGLERAFSGVLVNATPAGMWPDVDGCPIRPEALDTLLSQATGVADLIYNPPETVLVRAARRRGLPACMGMGMLIAQAVAAEALWQRRPMPDDLVDILTKELKPL